MVSIFDTKHAVAIKGENGTEILIHIGVDTVNLGGKHFKAMVKDGDKVKAGDVLVEFDAEAIQAEGYPIITPVLVTNASDYTDVITVTGKVMNVNQPIIKCY